MRTQHVHANTICQTEELSAHENHSLAAKLDAAGWGLFFVWVGTAFLMDIDPGIGLLGIGTITLGMQAIRKFFNLSLEGFWVVIGLGFMAGGVWELFNVQLPLPPILFLVAGLALLLSVVKDKQQRSE